MPHFNFSEKGLKQVSPPHFVYNFSKKCFLCYTVFELTNRKCVTALKCEQSEV